MGEGVREEEKKEEEGRAGRDDDEQWPSRYKISFCLRFPHQSKFSSAKLLAGDVICARARQSSFSLVSLSPLLLIQAELFQRGRLYLWLSILLIIRVFIIENGKL